MSLTLYFAPGACSLAPHAALRAAGLDFTLEKVDLRSHLTASGQNFYEINEKGYVPVLTLADGQTLTEVPVLLLYIADQVPERGLAPPATSFERYRLMERLNYLATEVHRIWTMLFSPSTPDEVRPQIRERILQRLALLDKALGHAPFLGGEQMDVSDVYLATLLNWARWTQVDLTVLPNVPAYLERMLTHPTMREAIDAEKAMRTQTNLRPVT